MFVLHIMFAIFNKIEGVYETNDIYSVCAGIYRTQILSQTFLDFTSVCVCGGGWCVCDGQTCKQGKIKFKKIYSTKSRYIKPCFWVSTALYKSYKQSL